MSLDAAALAALFELCRDAVVGEADGIVLFANPAARELLGAQAGIPAERCLPEDLLREPADRFVAAGMFGGRDLDVSVTRSAGSGSKLSLYLISRGSENTSDPYRDAASAELGSLLMTQRLALDMLVETTGAEDDEASAGYAAILYRTYYRLKRLQNHFSSEALLRADAQPSRKTLLALDEVFAAVCETADILAREKGVSVRFTAQERCLFSGDAALLETLLFNLLANSLLHTKSGDTIRVDLSRQGRRYVLAVDDPGSGIAPRRLSALMAGSPEPDYTDPGAGVGLGLSIVRHIARRHDGSLLIESRPDEGTRLRVTFSRPDPEELGTLREPDAYAPDTMDLALTELSPVLDKDVYKRRMFD